MELRTVLAGAVLAAGLVAQAAAQDAPFPVTIEHAFGETVIAAEPQRIVTIGWMSQDVVLALGEVPVGIPLQSWGGDENGVLPWVAEAAADLGGELPTRINTDSGIPFEQILALEPDVILARYSGLTAEEYARLSAIAPTVAYPQGPWAGTWQDITLTTGLALGKGAEAEALIAETDAYLAQLAADHPEFAGKTFTFAYYAAGSGSIGVYVATDSRVQMVEQLGLTLSPGAAALPTDGSFYVDVSLEQLDTMDADVLITWHGDEAELAGFRAIDTVARFAPVAEGRHVGLADRAFVMATSAPSVLSIPWSADRLVPELAGALQ